MSRGLNFLEGAQSKTRIGLLMWDISFWHAWSQMDFSVHAVWNGLDLERELKFLEGAQSNWVVDVGYFIPACQESIGLFSTHGLQVSQES